jgi:hypothetical protein
MGIAFDNAHCLGTWGNLDFAAQYPACVYPCQRFVHVLTGVPAWLGVIVGR